MVDPVAFHPVGVRIGRTLIVARDPDVSVAVPAVESGLPDEAIVRRRDDLDRARWRWADTDDDLGVRGRYRQRRGEYQPGDCGECGFVHVFHGSISL
jgi:hypothetical protein